MYTLFKEIKTRGCVMEDGADTRESTAEFVLVKNEELEQYHESCASEYGDQDYAYKFSSHMVAQYLDKDDLEQLKKVIEYVLEEDE